MTLIKSISGIRGTIGGAPQENLTPLDAVKFSAAYGTWLKSQHPNTRIKVVVGRDARPSGPMIQSLVCQTLVGMGIDIVDLGLSTTPTVEIAVPMESAHGGIILTASHNPKEWNALKLLNHRGEFIDAAAGAQILAWVEQEAFVFNEVDDLGTITADNSYMNKHIDAVLALELVDAATIQKAGFKVVVDGVHSSGGVFIPALLERLGVEVITLYGEPTGQFPHNPEPLAQHLGVIMSEVVAQKADLGIVVDPDVDRLAFISEDGSMFGEEYTLVACADYVLSKTPGATCSNLSSTRALRDVTQKHQGVYVSAAVGEVNVVETMKKNQVVIGGEGNGGIIYPASHYGRDALVGTALFLMLLAERKTTVSELRKQYPAYFMSKEKIVLDPKVDVDRLLVAMEQHYPNDQKSTIDGLKIDLADGWIHMRKSNTEPIVRIYTEAFTQEQADALAQQAMSQISALGLG
ncbi:MAG: phosphoglucosamine mutase [Flavobacteriaceae bacterium]|nr:phosphoglucosamine mutase [Flavobacteriaceae bacterium]MDP4794695.1 phosphoglucosamine mutase [Flavobacteriaceae bacterium]MDP4971245.1 phosphoglucosamine mutase [Flavobacteriaceae bacterium]